MALASISITSLFWVALTFVSVSFMYFCGTLKAFEDFCEHVQFQEGYVHSILSLFAIMVKISLLKGFLGSYGLSEKSKLGRGKARMNPLL